jgi:hypothetical protein
MTFDEIDAKLAATTFASGNMLFQPCSSSAGPYVEVPARDVVAAWTEIKRKLPLVYANVVSFSACEHLFYRMLVNHCEIATPLPQQADGPKGTIP